MLGERESADKESFSLRTPEVLRDKQGLESEQVEGVQNVPQGVSPFKMLTGTGH